MDKRINLELRGKRPSEVKELDLSGCKTGGDFDGLTEEFSNLEFIDCSNSNITNLKTFPKLTNLRKIDLSGNRLSKGLENLKECINLRHIILNDNRIKELETLDPLKSLDHLTHLEITVGELSGIDDLRPKIFALLPSLQYLDQEDIDGNEEEDDTVPNGKGGDDDEDDDDGDDELDVEEEEEEDEDESDEGEPGLETLYGVVHPEGEEDDDEFHEVDASDDDDEEEDDEDEEPTESTRGKFSSSQESTRGKKRKLEDDPDGGV